MFDISKLYCAAPSSYPSGHPPSSSSPLPKSSLIGPRLGPRHRSVIDQKAFLWIISGSSLYSSAETHI